MDLRAIHAQRLADQAAAKKAADEALLAIFESAKTAALEHAYENDLPAPSHADSVIAALHKVITVAQAERDAADDARSTDELFSAGHSAVERGHRKWVASVADEVAENLKNYDPCNDWDEWSRDQIEQAVDGCVVMSFDIRCVLFVSRNADYALDEGLVESATSENEIERAHYAFLADVTEELEYRGALEEPEPPSEAPESDPCPDTERPDEPAGLLPSFTKP